MPHSETAGETPSLLAWPSSSAFHSLYGYGSMAKRSAPEVHLRDDTGIDSVALPLLLGCVYERLFPITGYHTNTSRVVIC